MTAKARQPVMRRVLNRRSKTPTSSQILNSAATDGPTSEKPKTPAAVPQGVGSSGKPADSKELASEAHVEIRVLSGDVAGESVHDAPAREAGERPSDGAVAAAIEVEAGAGLFDGTVAMSGPVGLRKLVRMLLDPEATVEEGCAACIKVADLCTAGTRRNKLVQDALHSEGTRGLPRPTSCP